MSKALAVENKISDSRDNYKGEVVGNYIGRTITCQPSLEVPDGVLDTFTFPTIAEALADSETISVDGVVHYRGTNYSVTGLSPLAIQFDPGSLPALLSLVFASAVIPYVFNEDDTIVS